MGSNPIGDAIFFCNLNYGHSFIKENEKWLLLLIKKNALVAKLASVPAPSAPSPLKMALPKSAMTASNAVLALVNARLKRFRSN